MGSTSLIGRDREGSDIFCQIFDCVLKDTCGKPHGNARLLPPMALLAVVQLC